MFGKKALPVGVMVMLPVVALAALGVGYGLWTGALQLEGTVNTGRLSTSTSTCQPSSVGSVRNSTLCRPGSMTASAAASVNPSLPMSRVAR